MKKQNKNDTFKYNTTENTVSIDRDTLHYILRDDLMNKLLTELGITAFNEWYVETLGGEPPFTWEPYYSNYKGGKSSRNYRGMKKKLYDIDIKEELLTSQLKER